MSTTETKKWEVSLIFSWTKEQIENYCEKVCKNRWYSLKYNYWEYQSWKDALEDNAYDEYIITKKHIFYVDKCDDYYDEEDIINFKKIGEWKYSFLLRYYNWWTCFSEIMNDDFIDFIDKQENELLHAEAM